jgi:4-hydroxy-tetrahydrodipicolinate synthase
MKISGLIPASITPFDGSGAVDHESLCDHIRRISSATGLFGVAVNGHAGEILALSSEERRDIIATSKKALPKALKLIAGIESSSIDGLVREGLSAKSAGAEMLLVIPPFDARVYRHLASNAEVVVSVFRRLDREVGLPMIVFQYPDATGCAYPVDVLRRIADLPSVVGIKAAVATPTKYSELHSALADRLAVLASGDQPSLFGMLLHNAPGALIGISVVGVQLWSDLVREASTGSLAKAREIYFRVALPLMDAIYENQTHRTPISPFASTKEALVQLGELKSSWVRAPSLNVDQAKKDEIRLALAKAGLLKTAALAA